MKAGRSLAVIFLAGALLLSGIVPAALAAERVVKFTVPGCV